MISIKQIYEKDIELCYELDSNTISLWSKIQWASEFKKEGIQIFGILLSNLVIGICVLQVVLDEAQINYFAVRQKYRKRGFGSYMMNHLIMHCKKQNINKLLLEVSQKNIIAVNFYDKFEFSTVGIRRNYYKDGSCAFLKEKILTRK
tara:strand:+ start:1141 stop:1581 length:441 start_codon:yes stop_codon:yes gene_type:complete